MISRDTWYRNPEVLYNIIVQARDREIVFLSKDDDVMPVRNVMANYMGFLCKNFDAFNFYSRSYNLYYSLARYKQLQLFNFNMKVRKEQRLAWNESAISNTASFDFGLDFDSDGIDDVMSAHRDCKKVKELLDDYGVPYSLKFSGQKGFHLTIPFSELPIRTITADVGDDDSLFSWLKGVATLLDLKLGLPTLDLGIFDPRRIWKCDYSWVCETGLIALPLSDEQFDNFCLSMVEPLNVLKGGIRNRGDLLRKGRVGSLKLLVEDGLGGTF